MRTKALLGLAALAAGALTATAQNNVYSLNVVGYYNVAVPANQFVMIANQLNSANMKISALLPTAPPGAQLFKFDGQQYKTYTFDDIENAWLPDGNATLNPGEGAYIKSPAALTVTFVGEVPQGKLTNNVPAGSFAMRSSIVPQEGALSGLLGFPGEAGDQVFVFHHPNYATYTFDDIENNWLPNDPQIKVGEAFFSKKASTSTKTQWVRDFTVQ